MEKQQKSIDKTVESPLYYLTNQLSDEHIKHMESLFQKCHQLEQENTQFKLIYKAAKILNNPEDRNDYIYNIQAYSFFLLLKKYPQHLSQAQTNNKIPWELLFEWTNIYYNNFHKRLMQYFPHLTIQQQKQLCLFRIGLPNDKIALILQKNSESVRVEKARLLRLLKNNHNQEVSMLIEELETTKHSH